MSQSMATKRRSQADLGRDARKRVLGSVLRDPHAALGDKEGVIVTVPDHPIADRLIGREGLHRGGVQGHEPRFAEFGATDEERGLSAVEIAFVEADHLGAPESGHREKSKQCRVGAPTQPLRRRQRARPRAIAECLPPDTGAVDVVDSGRGADRRVGLRSGDRSAAATVRSAGSSEAAVDVAAEICAAEWPSGARARSSRAPRVLRGVPRKRDEDAAGLVQRDTEPPSQREVVIDSSAERRHCPPPMATAGPEAADAWGRPWRRSRSCAVADDAARRRCPPARRRVAAGRSPVNGARRARLSSARSPPLSSARRGRAC